MALCGHLYIAIGWWDELFVSRFTLLQIPIIVNTGEERKHCTLYLEDYNYHVTGKQSQPVGCVTTGN